MLYLSIIQLYFW